MIHIQNFSYAKRTLPAFICTNPRLNILPETRASPPGVPAGARTSGLSRGMLPKISHIFGFISSDHQFTVPPHPLHFPQRTLPTKRKPGARAGAKTPISRNRAVFMRGVVVVDSGEIHGCCFRPKF